MTTAPISPLAAPATEPSRIASGALAAIVFREVLAPLSATLGPVGDVVLDRVVDGLFVRPAR